MIMLSIIVPIYNVEKYISECLDSIQSQGQEISLEIICINDGSTDKSGLICEDYAKRDNRFRVIHQDNKGISYVRTLGLKMSRGKYIAWVDPDDYLSGTWLKYLMPILNRDFDIIFFDYAKIMKKGVCSSRIFEEKSRVLETKEFLEEIVIDQKIKNQLWNKVFKRKIIEGIVFPQNISVMEDYAVLHKIVLKAKKIYYVAKVLYYYRVRENSLVVKGTIERKYNSYLIAKERYKYLKDKNIIVSQIGYTMHALNFCVQYYKANRSEKKHYKNVFEECKQEVDKNINKMIFSKKCSNSLKLKLLLYKFYILKLAVIIKINILKNN